MMEQEYARYIVKILHRLRLTSGKSGVHVAASKFGILIFEWPNGIKQSGGRSDGPIWQLSSSFCRQDAEAELAIKQAQMAAKNKKTEKKKKDAEKKKKEAEKKARRTQVL